LLKKDRGLAKCMRAAFPIQALAGHGLESDVMIDQVLAWSNDGFRKDLGPLPDALRVEVRNALREFLDL